MKGPAVFVGRNAQREGRTWEELGEEAGTRPEARIPCCSFHIYPYQFIRVTLIKPVVNGLKGEMSGVRRKP